MKKLLCACVIILVAMSSLYARMHHDKNFLAVRSHNDNMAMEYSTWHKQTAVIDEDKWGGFLQATAFYQESTNKTDLGKYFGTYHNNEHQDFIGVKFASNAGSQIPTEVPLNSLYVIHDRLITYYGQDTYLYSYIKLRPHQESYGIRLDYFQKLDKISKGLYYKVSVPIVYVKNCMGATCTCTNEKQKLPKTGDTSGTGPTGTEVTFLDYLSGKVGNTATGYAQDCLKKAKVNGCQDTTGVADIEYTLGYNFLYEDKKHLNAYVCYTAPLGTKTHGEWLFEPVVGNHRHWALGMGVDGVFELLKDNDMTLDLVFNVNYKYLFEGTEVRTLGLRWMRTDQFLSSPNFRKWEFIKYGWYYLGGKHNCKGTFPLANVLTRKVRVTPGSLVEGMVNFAFNKGNFTFDLGYNFYAKESESVTVREWPCNLYAMASNEYDTQDLFNALTLQDYKDTVGHSLKIQDNVHVGPINRENLTTIPCTTPAYVTHKIFGGVGYAFNDWNYPGFVGLGGSWEFVQGSNAALDGWALWAKTGVSF